MEKQEGAAAVEEAQRIMDENPLLEITASSGSVMTVANHVNEFVLPIMDLLNLTDEQRRVFVDLARELDASLMKYGGEIPDVVTVVLSRSEISALDSLRRVSHFDRNLGLFQYSDAVTELWVGYGSAHKKFIGKESKVTQFLGRIVRGKYE